MGKLTVRDVLVSQKWSIGLASLLMVVIFGYSGWKTHIEIKRRTAEQSIILSDYQRWVASVKRLLPFEDQYRRRYRDGTPINNIVSLTNALELEKAGLVSSMAMTSIRSVDQVQIEKRPTDLMAVCVASNGASVLKLLPLGSAKISVSEMIDRTTAWLSREDLTFDSVSFNRREDGTPFASVERLCINMRL